MNRGIDRARLGRHAVRAATRWRNAAVCLLLWLAAGCIQVPRGTGLSRPTPMGSAVKQAVWLARVEILDPEVPDKSVVEDSLTVNVLEYLQEAQYSRTVNVLPGAPRPGDHILRLRFDRYRQQRAPHPAYIPGALLTLTMWIWFGGPIYTDTADLSGQLSVEEADGTVLAVVKSEHKESHSVSLWSPQFAIPSGIEARTAIVRDLFEQARNRMRQEGGGRP